MDTLVLANDTLVPGNFAAANIYGATGIAFDSGTNQLFVTGAHSVSVVSEVTGRLVTTVQGIINGGGELAYDPGRGEIFASDPGTNNVSVISDATDTVVANVPVGEGPGALVYDNHTGEIYVANVESDMSGNSTVSVIADVNNTVVATVEEIGFNPSALTYDYGTREVVVANLGSSNVCAIYDTNHTVAWHVGVDNFPGGIAYDPGKGELFVAGGFGFTKNVSIISDSTKTVVGGVQLGSSALAVVVDSSLHEVLIGDTSSNNVSVVSDSTDRVVTNVTGSSAAGLLVYDALSGSVLAAGGSSIVSVISTSANAVASRQWVGAGPDALAVDSGNQEVYVDDYAANYVTVFSAKNDSEVLRISAPVSGIDEAGLAYDPARGTIYAAEPGLGGYVVAISDRNNSVFATIPPYDGGYAPIVDNGTNQVFVTDGTYNHVSVDSDINNSLVGTVTVGISPEPGAYDYGHHQVFVGNSYSGTVSIISDLTDKVVATVPVGMWPAALTYDLPRGEVFVANCNSNSVSVISDETDTVVATIPVGSCPQGITYHPGDGLILVANEDSNTVSVISDRTNAVVATVTVGGAPIAIAADGENGLVYVANAGQGTVSILSLGPAYEVSINETGLPSGTPWSVSINGTNQPGTGSQLGFAETNGSYSFVIPAVPGYLGNLTRGLLAVAGHNVSVSVLFTVARYSVMFRASGLPDGTTWGVDFAGATLTNVTANGAGDISFASAYGTQSFHVTTVSGYTPDPVNGSVNVTRDEALGILFSLTRYTLSFQESGLPSGTNWSVMVAGQTEHSTTDEVNFTLPNGTVTFVVEDVNGYSPNRTSSGVTVAGANLTIDLTFTLPPANYPLTFSESGLAEGTNWSVTVNGTTKSSTGASVFFAVPRGNYTYSVGQVGGYHSNVSSGEVMLTDGPRTLFVSFSASTQSSPTGVEPTSPEWVLFGAVVAILVAAAGLALSRKRDRSRPPSGDPQTEPGGPAR